MKILKVHEPEEDGSVVMDCEFSEYEVNFFINYAVNDILKKQIELMEAENKRKCFDCEEEIDSETLAEHPDTEICSDCMNNE